MPSRRSLDFLQAQFAFVALSKLLDLFAVAFAWRVVWVMRFGTQWFSAPKGIPDLATYTRLTLPIALVFSAVFHVVGVYRRDRVIFGYRSLKKVVEGTLLATLVFIALLYFANQLDYSRVYLVLFGVMVAAMVSTGRGLLFLIWNAAEPYFVRPRRVLLMGSGELLDLYQSQLESNRPYPFEWVGYLGSAYSDRLLRARIPHLGAEGELTRLLSGQSVDVVVVSYPHQESMKFEPVLETLSNQLLEVKILPDYGRHSTFTYQAREECGIPLLVVNEPTSGATDRFLKRVVDFSGALFGLVVLSPLFALIALMVRLSSKGPVFYSQVRVGADGQVFRMHKFRSMGQNAETKTGAVWARPEDPRVTNVGRFLRKSNLDELPQLWNVLRGEMSLVGPRPERPVFVEQFRKEIPKYMLRHRMKSGMTGWAQVNGWRGNTSIEERIKHDLYYIGHWSHGLDLKILALTFLRGFFHRNAY